MTLKMITPAREKSVRDVEGQRAELIWPHYQRRKIAEKIIRCVQIALRPGPNIRNRPIRKTPAVIEGERLEFVVTRGPRILEHEQATAISGYLREYLRNEDRLFPRETFQVAGAQG